MFKDGNGGIKKKIENKNCTVLLGAPQSPFTRKRNQRKT